LLLLCRASIHNINLYRIIFHGTIYVKKFWEHSCGTHVHLQQEEPTDLPGDSLEFLDIVRPETHDSI